MPFGRGRPTWKQVRSLRLRDVATLVRIAVLLGELAVLQRILPLPNLLRFFDARPRTAPASKAGADRVIHLTNALLRRLYGQDYCFQRSIVLFHYFRKWGVPVRVHFGITKREEALTGHAWLDLHGTPFSEHSNPTRVYQTVYVYPPASAVQPTQAEA